MQLATSIDLGRPLSGDVIDLILDDHRRFESLLRDLRDSSTDRDDVRRALSRVVNHHLTEEELTLLNLARTALSDRARRELGEAFAAERNRLVDDGCGSLTEVRTMVSQARRSGVLDDDDDGDDED